MTLQEYVHKVLTGELIVPTPLVYTPEPYTEIITRYSDMGDMEPDGAYRCRTYHNDWVCTRTRGHAGRHVAREFNGTYCDDWAEGDV